MKQSNSRRSERVNAFTPLTRRTAALWKTWSNDGSPRRRAYVRTVLALTPAIIVMAVTAFFDLVQRKPYGIHVLAWAQLEIGISALVAATGLVALSFIEMRSARRRLEDANRAEEIRRVIAAIGVAASWDLDLNRLYQRVAQDLRSIIAFDRFTITSALSTGRMRVEFVHGDQDEGFPAGSVLPERPDEPDGLSAECRSSYRSNLTAAIPACNGTLTIRAREANSYGQDELDLLRQAVAQISPGIANAILFQASERRVKERTVLADIGRAATSARDTKGIVRTVDSSLGKLINYDHLGVVLIDDDDEAATSGEIVYWSTRGLSGWDIGTRVSFDPAIVSKQEVMTGNSSAPLGFEATVAADGSDSMTWMQAPLIAQERFIGVLTLSSNDPETFAVEESALMLNVSLQIAPAIQNARLLAAERKLLETLNRQNQELFESNNARKQFLSTVSHELKTPLTIISGFIDLLASPDAPEDPDEKQETLSIIRRNANRLDVLINDILDISRLDAGTFKINPEPFPVSQLISDLEASFQSLMRSKTQTMHVKMPEDEIWIDADRSRIEQVITNLLSNASKYSPEETEITLSCEVDENRLHISVADQGVGMTKEDQEKLFTAFFRVDNEATRQVAGTGLGLVIAKSIAELHGGEIRLESKPGVGTTIEFWIPGLTSKETAEQEIAEQQAITGSRLWPDGPPPELELGAD